MHKKIERRYVPPDGYVFLLAAGEIDRCLVDRERSSVTRCARELARIAGMNGTYELLPSEFRAHMREVTRTNCDTAATVVLGRLGDKLSMLDELSASERTELRAACSQLSRFWPMKPQLLLI